MAIRHALRTLDGRKQREPGLRRLDSPSEAAVVAAMCNRQDGEVVITSFGDPKPEEPEESWFLADRAPPSFRGTAKQRHGYVLGQYPHLYSHSLAHQGGLLPQPAPQQQHLQEQQQEQPEQVQPCSPPPAAVQELSCRTPVSQLRAEHLQVEDASPSNDLVRRLATNIKTDSPALTTTLAEYSYSSFRRSTASFRSRVSTHSDLSYEGGSTPLASPGRGWTSPPAAASRSSSQRGSSSGQSPSTSQGGAGGLPAGSAALGPSQLQLHMQALGLGGSSAHAGSPRSPLASPSCQRSAVQGPAGQQPVPSLAFSGFGGSARARDSAAGSIQLATPRLEPHWAPFSNNSSSNGTTASQDHFSSCNGSGSGFVEDRHGSMSFTAASDDKNELSAGFVAHAGLGQAGDSWEGGDEGAGLGSFTAGRGALTGTAGAADPSCRDAINSGASGQTGGAAGQAAACGERACVSPTGSNSAACGWEGAGQQAAAWPSMLGLERADSPGYWSCDEEGTTEAAGEAVEQTPSHSIPVRDPCQLPLTPMLLKELSKQLSFQEGAERCTAAACPANGVDDATTCGDDWATVYSYEQFE